jgi:glycine/D-amino acid oxidase-like deaminating enzyme
MPKDDQSAYGLSWYAARGVASPPRPRLAAETDVDVCVIGGGLAGLTVAREVARRGWSVLVLESKTVAWNASGRNTGFVLPGFAVSAEALVARVGAGHARKLWALSEAGAEYVRNAIRETGMPGADLTEGGWLQVSKTDADGAMTERYGILTGEFGAAVESWPAERVREALRSKLYFQALHYPRGFSINPLNYALGLAAAAEAAGTRICEDTPALQIDPVGVRKRIVIKDARVRAAHVVLAGNVHLDELMPQFATTLLPIYSYLIATAPLGEALREAIRYGGAVSDTELADNHYRVVDGDRLLWSGRSTVWHGKPQRYVDALRGDIARAYPSLRSVTAEYAWTGTIGSTVHRMPQIGEISPGLWLLSGFGGHGLNTTAMGGELLARAIVEGDATWQLFNPFAMVWAGGLLGRATQQAYYWSFRSGERVGNWLARRREARRRGLPGVQTVAEALMDTAPPPAALPVEPEPTAAEPQPEAPRRNRRRKRSKADAPDTSAPGDSSPAGGNA